MTGCPYEASKHILDEIASRDVWRMCRAVTLFQNAFKQGTFARFTSSKRWTTAWKEVLHEMGLNMTPDIHDAKRLQKLLPVVTLADRIHKSKGRPRKLFPRAVACKRLIGLQQFVDKATGQQLAVFVVARSRGLDPEDADGYVGTCIDMNMTVLGKRLCHQQWQIDPVPDRYEDVWPEEEGEDRYKKAPKRTVIDMFNLVDMMQRL